MFVLLHVYGCRYLARLCVFECPCFVIRVWADPDPENGMPSFPKKTPGGWTNYPECLQDTHVHMGNCNISCFTNGTTFNLAI